MKSLLRRLEARDSDSLCLILKDLRYTTHEFLELVKEVRSECSLLKNRRVVLVLENIYLLPIYLTALDGFAASVMLLSESSGKKEKESLERKFRGEYWLSEHGGRMIKSFVDDVSLSEPIITNWILSTSGTTSSPKLVSHTLESLSGSLKFNTRVGKNLIWGMLYESTKFAGIQVILQALLGYSALAMVPIDSLKEAKVNALSATPTMWRKLMMTGELKALQLHIITLGGEICDNKILTKLKLLYPQAKIAHVYASTEAGIAFSVKDGFAGFPSKWLGNSPIEGLELKIETDVLFIKKNTKTGVYIEEEQLIEDNFGWIDTGDLVKLDGERVLFCGRANGMINVGGQKVQPEEIEQVLLKHEQVDAALVSSKSNPFIGHIVIASVVGNFSSEVEANQILREFCSNFLGSYKVPAMISLVSEIDMTNSGKIRR